MDSTIPLTLNLQSIIRMNLFGERPRVVDFYGPMGDFSETKNEIALSTIGLGSLQQNGTAPDPLRFFNSRYRPSWEMGSDKKRDEDEYTEELVDRVILSASMNDADDDEFGLARPFDYSGRKPVNYLNLPKQKNVQVESLIKEKHRKSPNKLDRKIRRVRNGQDSVDDVIYMAEELPPGCFQRPPNMPPGPTICLPLLAYRRMIGAELVAEGRIMQEYYAAILHSVRQEKDGALRQQIFWQDRAQKAELDAAYYEGEALTLRTIAGNMREEIHTLREAKRRRRNAKKTRHRVSTNQSGSSVDVVDGDDEAEDDVSGHAHDAHQRGEVKQDPTKASNKTKDLSDGEHVCKQIPQFLSGSRIVQEL